LGYLIEFSGEIHSLSLLNHACETERGHDISGRRPKYRGFYQYISIRMYCGADNYEKKFLAVRANKRIFRKTRYSFVGQFQNPRNIVDFLQRRFAGLSLTGQFAVLVLPHVVPAQAGIF